MKAHPAVRVMCATFLALHFLLPQISAGAEQSGACRELKLSEKEEGDNRVYSVNEKIAFVIGYDDSLDSSKDYGARFMLRKKKNNAISRSYYSSGSADSYGMRPTFIKDCGGHGFLIFAETGTEYSWGLRVFSYNDGRVEDLGYIPLAVEGEFDAESVIPFMKVSQKQRSITLSFTRDLIRNPGSKNER